MTNHCRCTRWRRWSQLSTYLVACYVALFLSRCVLLHRLVSRLRFHSSQILLYSKIYKTHTNTLRAIYTYANGSIYALMADGEHSHTRPHAITNRNRLNLLRNLAHLCGMFVESSPRDHHISYTHDVWMCVCVRVMGHNTITYYSFVYSTCTLHRIICRWNFATKKHVRIVPK